MGYSSRYHAASLAAVFIALAVGILIGVGLADDVITTASQEVEQSLRGDLEEARAEIEDLRLELDRQSEFAHLVMPVLIDRRLAGTGVAVVGMGGLAEETAVDVQEAVDASGGSLEAVAALTLPPDREALAEAAGGRVGPLRRDEDALRQLGRAVGGGIVGGTPLIDRVSGALFSRFSGSLEGVDAVVVVPELPAELDADEKAAADALVAGFTAGLAEGGTPVVATQRANAEPTSLEPLIDAGLAAVEHVDVAAGKVSLVLALAGADGHYGYSDDADRFLPELAGPAAPAP